MASPHSASDIATRSLTSVGDATFFPPTSARQQVYHLTEATVLWSRRRWPQMVRLLCRRLGISTPSCRLSVIELRADVDAGPTFDYSTTFGNISDCPRHRSNKNAASTSLATLAIVDAPTWYKQCRCSINPPSLESRRQQDAQIRSYQAPSQVRTEAQSQAQMHVL